MTQNRLFNFLKRLLNFTKKLQSEAPNLNHNNVAEEIAKNGKKLALIVGINKYQMPGADLNGCVNDAEDIWNMLIEKGYNADNIRMLTDFRATQQNILERLEWLVSNLKSGDEGFFHYSGHGSFIRSRQGDTSELDDYQTEIIVPTDMNWDDPLTDDILANYFKRVQEGAFLYFIADCCHSGSINRGIQKTDNPHPWKSRFIAPPLDIAVRSQGRDLDVNRLGRRGNNLERASNVYVINQRHLLLSGCRDNQTSADAFINGKWGGALSQNFLRILKENKEKSWIEIHQLLISSLQNQSYTQVPQLTGPENVINKVPFS